MSFKMEGISKISQVFAVQKRGESLSRELIPLSHQAPGTGRWHSEEVLHLLLLSFAEDQAAVAAAIRDVATWGICIRLLASRFVEVQWRLCGGGGEPVV